MIKFKQLVNEINNDPKENAEKFLRLIRSGDFIVPQKEGFDLYRGTDESVVVDVKKRREREGPLNTGQLTHDIIDLVAEVEYPDFPLRSYSRFASTSYTGAKNYGIVHYVFPAKNAKIVSFLGDTYIYYFSDIKPYGFYNMVQNAEEDVENFYEKVSNIIGEDLVELIKAYCQAANYQFEDLIRVFRKMSLESQVSYLKKKKGFIDSRNLETMGLGHGDFTRINNVISRLQHMAMKIHEYFQDATTGVEPGSGEVIIEGDLLHARYDFVNDYLKFNESKQEWELDLY